MSKFFYQRLSIILSALLLVSCGWWSQKPIDVDGDGWSPESGDCNDMDANYHPGSTDPLLDCDESTTASSSSSSASSSGSSAQTNAIELISNFVTQQQAGKTGFEFLKAVGAIGIKTIEAPIQNAKLIVDVTANNYPSAPNPPKSVGIGIYIEIADARTLRSKRYWYRFLDAEWQGNCSGQLNDDWAEEKGGVFFIGQFRRMEFDLSEPLPLAKENRCETGKDNSVNLLALMNNAIKNNELIHLGFYSSNPEFVKINKVTLEYAGGKIERQTIIPY